MKRFISIGILCLLSSWAQAQDVQDKTVVLKSGDEVRYSISVPDDYDSKTPKPLIVALHYGGRVTPHYARGIVEMLVNPGLGELDAIVVAPDSIAGPWTNDKNEAMVLELMDFIGSNYGIEEGKTILTGFSMGGHGTWYIGSRNQERFSALIPVASYPGVEDGVNWTTPVYAIHSSADTVVPIKYVDSYVSAQVKEGNEQIVLITVENLPHYQTAAFAVPLQASVPWVRDVWSQSKQ